MILSIVLFLVVKVQSELHIAQVNNVLTLQYLLHRVFSNLANPHYIE